MYCAMQESFLILSLIGTLSQAQTYRWVDENGEVHNDDKKPTSSIKRSSSKRKNKTLISPRI